MRIDVAHTSPEQIEMCRRWIRLFGERRQTINSCRSSYGLKHDVEHWTRSQPEIDKDGQTDPQGRRFTTPWFYVSNDSFLAAAAAEGYTAKQIGFGPNAHFNMGLKKWRRWLRASERKS